MREKILYIEEDGGMMLLPSWLVWERRDEGEKALKSVSQDGCQADEISLEDVTSTPLTTRRLLDVSHALERTLRLAQFD